jgi:type II secretory pathway pseudopilin PulG
LVLLIGLSIALAWTVLASDEAKQQERRETEAYEAARDRYIDWVRAQYEKPSVHQYSARKHHDFTGGEELSGLTLEEIKREIVKG